MKKHILFPAFALVAAFSISRADPPPTLNNIQTNASNDTFLVGNVTNGSSSFNFNEPSQTLIIGQVSDEAATNGKFALGDGSGVAPPLITQSNGTYFINGYPIIVGLQNFGVADALHTGNANLGSSLSQNVIVFQANVTISGSTIGADLASWPIPSDWQHYAVTRISFYTDGTGGGCGNIPGTISLHTVANVGAGDVTVVDSGPVSVFMAWVNLPLGPSSGPASHDVDNTDAKKLYLHEDTATTDAGSAPYDMNFWINVEVIKLN